jgi:hypothetical protein
VVSKRAGQTAVAVVLSHGEDGRAWQHMSAVQPPAPHAIAGFPICSAGSSSTLVNAHCTPDGGKGANQFNSTGATLQQAHTLKPTAQTPKSAHVFAMQHVVLSQL